MNQSLYVPLRKKRRTSKPRKRTASDSSRTSLTPSKYITPGLLVIIPEVLVAYILQYCGKKDFFLFGRISFEARHITRNPSYKRMFQCHAFLDRFHDYELPQADSCELRPYHIHLRFFAHNTDSNSDSDAEMEEVDEKTQFQHRIATPVALRTPAKFSSAHCPSPPSVSRYSLPSPSNIPSIPNTPTQVSNRMMHQATPPRTPQSSFQSDVVRRELQFDSPSRNQSRYGSDIASIPSPDTSSATVVSGRADGQHSPKRHVAHPFRQLRHLIHTLEFEFSDIFWKDVGLSSNANFLALFANAHRLIIYDSERGRSLDPSAFVWPACKAHELSADASVLHTYALHSRHLFPRRLKCDTWGDLAVQAELIQCWSRQSRAAGYETRFEIDVELPRIMTEGYIEHVSGMFGSPDFPFVERFSTNICNYQNSTWDGVLVLPPTQYVILNYEHTCETQKWSRSLDFRQCAFHSVAIEWNIKWCRKAENARFMVTFLESLAVVLWGASPSVWIQVSHGDYKKVRAFLSCLESDLSWANSSMITRLRNVSFSLGLSVNGVNGHHSAYRRSKIDALCDAIRRFGVDMTLVVS